MKSKINIYIVDDHGLFREGVKFLLSTWDYVSKIYEAESASVFLNDFESKQIDLVLMDIDMPEINGIEATKQAIRKNENLIIIALSMHGNENYYREMLNAGAKGFLLKNSNFEDVKNGITEVMQGRSYFSPEILNSIISNLNKDQFKAENKADLSKREIEVLYHICKGLSNQEIADKLFRSRRTIDKHRENLLLKTNAKNTAELVVFAIKNSYFKI
jgi:DNA-binding NarL/FixJ family response regulator